MEFFIGFIIQLAGIVLLLKISFSLLCLVITHSLRFMKRVMESMARLQHTLTPKPKRLPMAVPKAAVLSHLKDAFYKESDRYDMAFLETPTFLRRQPILPMPVVEPVCKEFS